MRRAAMFLAILSLAFAPAPRPKPPKPDTAKTDLKAMQGVWRRTRLTIGGDANREVAGSVTMHIKDDVMDFGSPGDAWKLTLDTTGKGLRRMDSRNTKRAGLFLGVYRIENDTLTVCWRQGSHEADRPVGFDPGQPKVWLCVYQRVRP